MIEFVLVKQQKIRRAISRLQMGNKIYTEEFQKRKEHVVDRKEVCRNFSVTKGARNTHATLTDRASRTDNMFLRKEIWIRSMVEVSTSSFRSTATAGASEKHATSSARN
ncbi:hypothetical protein TNCV_910761 [Trichonephila clavipes]|uniref:Uncharacterized protein n=1 Tax=Trichonephila clavipes TaxID=2585209 RepID=A0A8X6W3Y3_TRICX|nr:hypothetical protein TNCV_910761 [Trichonephila clavipes]